MSGEIAVRVDLANPGQYFACCGLLELAHRMSLSAEACFADGHFALCGAGGGELMQALRTCEIFNTMTAEQLQRRAELSEMGQRAMKEDPALEAEKKELDSLWRESPVIFGRPFGLRCDWFCDDQGGGKRFKTWAGQQSIIDIVNGLQSCLPEQDEAPADWLSKAAGDAVPLNFDSNLGGAGADIDVGFSFDPLKAVGLRVGIRPAIELLAFVGLQRFRPEDVGGGAWGYGAWKQPLGAELASFTCCGVIPQLPQERFRFRLLYRTKYLKSFLPGRPV